jgi:hypothetical protein
LIAARRLLGLAAAFSIGSIGFGLSISPAATFSWYSFNFAIAFLFIFPILVFSAYVPALF